MISKLVSTGLAVALVGVGLIAAAPQSAQAGQPKFGVTIQGSHGSIHIGKSRHHGPRYGYRARTCQPGEAVYKARKHGVHRAHVERVGRRFVVVSGRKRGQPVTAAFERDTRNCRLAWMKVDRKHGWDGHKRGHGKIRPYRAY